MSQLKDEGIKLYAISYDDTEALEAYTHGAGIEFTMLSDERSEVIRQYGVFNTLIGEEEAFFHGIPFPGFFLVDEAGVIRDKLFNPHLAVRDGVESILDSFLGRTEPGRDDPVGALTEDDGIEVTAVLRGGGGVLRVGPRRRLVVRFEMPQGLHIYGEPVPDGIVATRIEVEAPEGVRCEAIESPFSQPFELPGVDATLEVWEGQVDFVIPLFANNDLLHAVAAAASPSIELTVNIHYQACDDHQCFIPRRRTITLNVPLGKNATPSFLRKAMGENAVRGSEEVVDMDTDRHMQRLAARQAASLAKIKDGTKGGEGND